MATYWEMMTRPEHQPQIAIPVCRLSPDELEDSMMDEFENEYHEFIASSETLPSEQMGFSKQKCSTALKVPVQLRRQKPLNTSMGNWTPDFVPSISNNVIRDQGLVRRLKRRHAFKCQLCGHRIRNPKSEEGWSCQAHHIKPLGDPHFGPDVAENIIVVCPNHHTEFENGVVDLKIENLRNVNGHDIAIEFVEYNNNEIFIPC